ncbi:NAD(+)--arginine ADP-ribosyltransferase Chelt [Colletotrichum liriopes]|uniref:NAD(+)--arginine ADP-ribosyltransferase Chelt n=1 Tax=Colletotrichum liriopes TaxID=708192 RepID=A0AA37GFF9_9PEZI|nr:NAD(+)--arginine ADP-ribosyltransferase Chelt [Colletotrichum liriopes]
MLASSLFVFLALLASAVSAVTLYRGDTRGPAKIKESGGFHARGNHDDHENYGGTVFEHVTKSLKYPSKDPYISTSIDIEAAKKHGESKYLYHLDRDQIEENIIDVAAAYADEGKTYPYPNEKEFSVEYHIPWEAITKVERNVEGQWRAIKFSKRGVELFDEGVFVD